MPLSDRRLPSIKHRDVDVLNTLFVTGNYPASSNCRTPTTECGCLLRSFERRKSSEILRHFNFAVSTYLGQSEINALIQENMRLNVKLLFHMGPLSGMILEESTGKDVKLSNVDCRSERQGAINNYRVWIEKRYRHQRRTACHAFSRSLLVITGWHSQPECIQQAAHGYDTQHSKCRKI